MPRSLDETYDRILLGISWERQEYAQRLLQCLAESIRPLCAEELAEILAIQFDTGTVPNYDFNWRPEDPEEAVLSACSSLITIVDMDTSRVVQFSHFSVKEYLSSDRLAARKDLSQYHIIAQSAHTILARVSLSVLLALDDQVDKETMKNFPLAVYAARYWVDHAQFDNVCSSIKVAMERLFDPTKPHFPAWVWIYDIDFGFREIMFDARPTPPKAVPLYYATLCGFCDLVEHLVASYPRDVNARGGLYGTPLHAAVAKGNIDVMMLLLQNGADVAAVDRDGFTPLYEASRRRRFDMMSLLFDHHADVNSQDERGRTALFRSSSEREPEVARVLLRHGAATDIGDTEGFTPLIVASRHGHLDIACLLLENGAAVDLQDNYGWTSLWSAARYGHPNLVRLLLEGGAAVDLQDSCGWTPLMAAAYFGLLDVVRLLLESGAAVDLQDSHGCTPLFPASQRGYLDVARLLIQNGASVDHRNDVGMTSLMLASDEGRLEVVHLLVQNGASVDSRNNQLRTPLALASENGRLDVVRLLLQCGATANSSLDSDGGTS